MAVAIDNTQTFVDAVVTSITFAFSVASSRKLSVRVGWVPNGQSIVGVTWNGTGLTLQGSVVGSTKQSAIYTSDTPFVGSANIVVTFTGDVDSVACVAQTYSGANGGFTAINQASGTGTTASDTVSGPVTGDLVIDTVVAGDTLTIGANQTADYTTSVFGVRYGFSNQAGADGGAMTWSIATSQAWVMQALIVTATAASSFGGPTIAIFPDLIVPEMKVIEY